ncbi:GINS complex subunit Sld5 [Spironucleus salmonicida]|uniref:GINS complex subunit Sld5 n=1 Tax=Spironucleus salmonicida TaxID=348837 RepID=V6LLW4_9EUKA|nr:GINS complex subunit Sld5 [Spironucleus salmonicida]|eukprot:EST45198.1 GINS complex subunit Sld5 [Spironucleus salmonicida]
MNSTINYQTQSLSQTHSNLRVGSILQLTLAEALELQKHHLAIIQLPEFLTIKYLQNILEAEQLSTKLAPLPQCYFSSSQILLSQFQSRPEIFDLTLIDELFSLRHQIRQHRQQKLNEGELTNATLDELQMISYKQQIEE